MGVSRRIHWTALSAGVYISGGPDAPPVMRVVRQIMNSAISERLRSQLAFLNEIERLKIVYRGNGTFDRSRRENSAEHSWHAALMALVLAEHSQDDHLDLFRVVKVLLIHDLVEIYAGDTPIFSENIPSEQLRRELVAAEKLFALLPDDQAREFRGLWIEFADRQTPEAVFAASIDSLQGLTNWSLSGSPEDGLCVRASEVLERKRHIRSASTTLWEVALELVQEADKKGLYGRH
jgi:putative hydrolases of HD superfamily